MINQLYTFILLFGLLCFTGCNEEDEPQPITVNFTNTSVGISTDNPQVTVSITFSRPAATSGTLNISVNSNNLTYGQDQDFYTNPAANNNTLALNYRAGDDGLSFEVLAGTARNIQQDEQVVFSIDPQANTEVLVGINPTLSLTFSENFIALSGTVELNGGNQGSSINLNQAFFDLSKLLQTTVDKKSWDIGFYTASGEHRVVLNGSAGVMARPLNKNDLNAVTVQDTVGFAALMTIPPPGFDASIGSVAWIDAPDGDLSKTAFGNISATDTNNQVFIVKDATGTAWKKVRVLQNGANYTLQYADIEGTSFNTLTITKNQDYNHIFFDFTNGIVSVEPPKDQWDLMYGSYTEILNVGGPGADIPYSFNDYIILNRDQVSVAMVMTSAVSYEDFGISDLAALTFSSKTNAIGASWRQGGGPSSPPALYSDRFYVINDTQGNIYKLKFTRLTSTSGQRGYPEFIYEKVQ
ncbi:MAG: HmuY family protein [Microscillaceae bacterium]|nr:HmuY family protein [Microscillaceae bacterium]